MATSNSGAIAVDVKEITVITPSEATPSHVLPLSTLDSQLFLRFTIEYLLLYRPHHHHSRHHTAARLKHALARSLVPYYPLAGRLRPRPDSPSSWNLLSLQVPDVVLSSLPPLILQLTWLHDGSAALALAFNHCIIDGIGTANFLNSFADLASGRSRLSDLRPVPVWDRHLVPSLNAPTTARTTKTASHHHPEFLKVPDLWGFAARFDQEPLVPTSVVFDGKKISDMKNMALKYYGTCNSKSKSKSSYTGFEVCEREGEGIWGGPHHQEGGVLREWLRAGVRGGERRGGGGLGVGRAAEAVRRAKDAVGEEGYVREVVEAVGAGACPDMVGVLVVSQWSRLGLDRVDFGMGNPVSVGPLCTDRYCLILPVFGQRDAVRVVVALPRSAVARYEYLVRNPTS
ncbi:hypothetical protein Sjap_014174 [Stephania japonica]|uniref:Uncharacterized protein n=1 Tax=Stephania japonica TaxID=461633 RepID=A0AAP0IZ56_9MAGN